MQMRDLRVWDQLHTLPSLCHHFTCKIKKWHIHLVIASHCSLFSLSMESDDKVITMCVTCNVSALCLQSDQTLFSHRIASNALQREGHLFTFGEGLRWRTLFSRRVKERVEWSRVVLVTLLTNMENVSFSWKSPSLYERRVSFVLHALLVRSQSNTACNTFFRKYLAALQTVWALHLTFLSIMWHYLFLNK
jgi:hypothetical protein